MALFSKKDEGLENVAFKPTFKNYLIIMETKFWKLIELNLLYLLISAPLVALIFFFYPYGQGETYTLYKYYYLAACFLYMTFVGFAPITAGFSYVIRNYASDEHSWLFSDFFSNIKSNFKKSIVVALIDVFVLIILLANYIYYKNFAQISILTEYTKYIIIIIAALYYLMHIYLYPILVTFDMPLKSIYKNAFLMTLGFLPRTVAVLLISLAVTMLVFGFDLRIGIVLSVIFLVAVLNFTATFITYPLIQKYMIGKK